ncbi:ABC transporter ATP-binding protein [Dendrosporobacter sp. 1207_IL3150]|uniref:ABC transporter ATP-binding protein n=1 Tax=Dendrosporobacter sp. 1207_IL3150 TaxID=3084054 RepID=UPI002FD9214A
MVHVRKDEIILNNIITAQALGKSYGGFRALKGISFNIKEGECFGFLGHNGAGKSTTMRMIYGLSTVDEGTLSMFGQKIILTPPEIKSKLGIVPQEDNLDPDLTVIENLEVYGALFGLDGSKLRERSKELLISMGLQDKENSSVESLSGGLKRRLVIARALINAPKIVVLDEPTTGLDPQARHLVWQKLRSLKSIGVTLILTTHYMEEAMQICDRLVVMHEGEILAEGSPRELIARCVLPYVIELHMPADSVPSDLREKVEKANGEILQVADGIFLYCENGQLLWEKLKDWGIPQHACLLRPSNLEDVFLKLTGKGEEE